MRRDMLHWHVAIVWPGPYKTPGDCQSSFVDPLGSYFDNVMTKFKINNRTDAWKSDVNLLSPSQTIATCQRNISQHCWAQHVACVLPPCCKVLRHVCCCWLKFENGQIRANNTQHTSEFMEVHIFEVRRVIGRYDCSSQLYTQLKQLWKEPEKKFIPEPITSALPVQCSINCAIKPS